MVSNQPLGPKIRILVNGAGQLVPPGLNIPALLAELGLDSSRVAVELNRKLVRKPDWPATPVHDGDSLEIVTFVGGG